MDYKNTGHANQTPASPTPENSGMSQAQFALEALRILEQQRIQSEQRMIEAQRALEEQRLRESQQMRETLEALCKALGAGDQSSAPAQRSEETRQNPEEQGRQEEEHRLELERVLEEQHFLEETEKHQQLNVTSKRTELSREPGKHAEGKKEKSKTGPKHVQKKVAQTAGNTRLFYEKLLPAAEDSHLKNQRRLRSGVVWLFVLPILLLIIRNMTDSSKIAFLILWIIGMFLIAAFLVFVAYMDDELQKNLSELQTYVPGAEPEELGNLLPVNAEGGGRLLESVELSLQRARRVRETEGLELEKKEGADAEHLENYMH